LNGELLQAILEQTQLPVAENCFEQEQRLPYIAYLETGSNNFYADNCVYQSACRWKVELYTKPRDRESQRLLENILNQNEICWEKSKVYNKEERYNLVIYEFEEKE